MTEAELRRAILCARRAEVATDGELVTTCPGDCIAHLLGWVGMYLGPAQTSRGWRTPARGDLGPGWPDLVLLRPQTRSGPARVVFAELKRDGVLVPLHQLAVHRTMRRAGLEVYVWRPGDLDSGAILQLLQHGPDGVGALMLE